MAGPAREIGVEGVSDAVEVGRGGFAVVYRAYQQAFDRTVAVKILTTTPDATGLQRFTREVRAMGKLSEHPGIATVLDAGQTDDGRPYLLMPYFSGGSLQDALLTGRTYDPTEAASIGAKLASALSAAHAEGILHRDVKPANVMVDRYGNPLLVDFGIARIAGGHETTTGVVTTTLHHAAPELLDGKRPSVASDVYALGSTLFMLVSGRPPFASDTDESVVPLIRRIATDPVPTLPAGGPDGFQEVIERAMAKDPADRYPDAAAMGRALEAVSLDTPPAVPAGESDRHPPAPVPAADSTQDSSPPEPVPGGQDTRVVEDPAPPAPPSDPTPGPRRTGGSEGPAEDRRRIGPGLAAGALVVLAVVVGAVLLNGDGADDPSDGAATTAVSLGNLDDVPLVDVDESELRLLVDAESSQSFQAGTVEEVAVPATGALALDFDVSEPSALRASTAQVDPIDPVLALLSADGAVLAADDDSGSDTDSLLDYPLLEPGAYSLHIAGLTDEAGVVSLSLQLSAVPDIGDGSDGQLDDVHVFHAYSVVVEPGNAAGVRVESDGPVTIRVLDEVGAVVDGTGGVGEVEVDLRPHEPGLYTVMLSPDEPPVTYGIFPLQVAELEGAADTGGDGEPFGQAFTDVPPLEAVTTEQGVGRSAEFLRVGEAVGVPFTGQSGSMVRVVARTPDGQIDPVVALYADDGELVAASDDDAGGIDGTDAVVDVPLQNRPYVAVISDLGGDAEGEVNVLVALGATIPLRSAPPGELSGPDIPDRFILAVRPGMPPPASVRVEADADFSVRLLDEGGGLISQTEEGGNPPLTTANLGPGDYFVIVSSDSAANPGQYTVVLDE